MSTTPPPVQPSAEPTGLTPNLAGGLAYITIIPAIIFLVVAPYNRDPFIRFHSWQSLILGVAWIIVDIILRFFLVIPFLGLMIFSLVGLVFFIIWLIAMLKAFQGQKWMIPVIGNVAEQQASKGGI